MANYKTNEPTADVLMTSMRSMGYTFESAIADIIDNSITAKACLIEIKFPIDPKDSYVAICDNGEGMSSSELFDAMKYGSELKANKRTDDDLGRFGLGLKAASLSQCRKLTVVSKKLNKYTAYVWDLDCVEEKREWVVIEYNQNEIKKIKFIEFLEFNENGTIVLWENFDFLEKSSGSVYNELIKLQEQTSNYLSLIFHRFLNNEVKNKISIKINNYFLIGKEPFLERHKKTNIRREIKISIKDSHNIDRYVTVRPYVLPFQTDLSKEDIKKLGDITDYRTKQGYYIYRNNRLIIWGTWFGRPKGELTKNARIKVDIPNTLDDIWGIDIKKQNAKIPFIIKKQLTKAVDEAMNIAIKAQTYRGRLEKVDENIDYIWDRVKEREEQYTYKINKESKIFDIIRDDIDSDVWNKIDMILEEIENSVPFHQIYIDKSQNKINEKIDLERLKDIELKARILIDMTLKIGDSNRKSIIDNIFNSEPFNKFPKLKEKLIAEGE